MPTILDTEIIIRIGLPCSCLYEIFRANLCSGSLSNDSPGFYSHTEKETASGGRISAFTPSGNLTATIYALFFWSGKIGLTSN